MASQFKTVIFDLDGVLINSLETMKKAFEIAYAKIVGHGNPPFDGYVKHLGKSFKQIMEAMGLPENMASPYADESNRLIDKIELYAEISGVLSALKMEGFNLGVATGKDGNRARKILERLGILDYFGLVIGGDEVLNAKPDPEIINKHLMFFKTSPDKTIFVGDSLSDLVAGKKAGVITAAALWGYGEYKELCEQHPDYWMAKPEDLLNIVFG